MSYPYENFYPTLEPRRSFGHSKANGSQVFEAASRKAATAIERTRWTAESLVEIYTYWRRLRETTRQLAGLDDATLRDIGLHRRQIPYVAQTLARKKQRRKTGRG